MGHLYIVFCTMLCTVGPALSSWGSPPGAGSPDGQYHIQTDEGPERYFRYQTQSGQYRKEKRLQDGTVIGSYGWIDADGYLRLRDYIADDEGYRILKSKTVYVGQNRPIEEAIKSAKKVAPQAGILVGAGRPSSVYPARGTPAYPSAARLTPVHPTAVNGLGVSVTPAPTFSAYLPPSSTPAPFVSRNSLDSITEKPEYDLRPIANPVSVYGTGVPVTSTPAFSSYPPPSSTPLVLLSHNSIESSTQKPEYDFRPTVAPIAAESYTQKPPAYYSSTERPAPQEVSSSTYLPPASQPSSSTYTPPLVQSSTYLPPVSSTYSPLIQYSSTPAPVVAITSNVLGNYRKKYGFSPVAAYKTNHETRPDYGDRNLYSTNTLNLDPFGLQSTPIDRADQYRHQQPQSHFGYPSTDPASYSGNQIGNGYNPQYPLYDGVSVTKNGFRYYLPKQYHEEENSGSDTRAGSFGYVDPFGIRRVIYYNTSPGSGFVHRKNNRYVGFDATPYDPRPL